MLGIIVLLLSIVLVVIGFIMVVTGVAIKLLSMVLMVIYDTIQAITFLILRRNHKKNVTSKLDNANWTKKELAIINQIEHSKRKKYEDNARTEVYEGIVLFSSRMKAKYPNADAHLFNKIEKGFLQASDLNVFDNYERMIRESHIRNSR